jgi:hypothetical protein
MVLEESKNKSLLKDNRMSITKKVINRTLNKEIRFATKKIISKKWVTKSTVKTREAGGFGEYGQDKKKLSKAKGRK